MTPKHHLDFILRFHVRSWTVKVPDALWDRRTGDGADAHQLESGSEPERSGTSPDDSHSVLIGNLQNASPALLLTDLGKRGYVPARVNLSRSSESGSWCFAVAFVHECHRPQRYRAEGVLEWTEAQFVSHRVDGDLVATISVVAPTDLAAEEQREGDRDGVLVDILSPEANKLPCPIFYLRLDQEHEVWIGDPRDSEGRREVTVGQSRAMLARAKAPVHAEQAAQTAGSKVLEDAVAAYRQTGEYDLTDVLVRAKSAAFNAAQGVYLAVVAQEIALSKALATDEQTRWAGDGALRIVDGIRWDTKVRKSLPKALRERIIT